MRTAIVFLALCGVSQAGTFVQPELRGQSPSGISWASIATGTAMPTSDGRAGAVAYIKDGVLQLDPKGLSISFFSFSYPSGTMAYFGPAVSSPYGQEGLLPAGLWGRSFNKTNFAAIVGGLSGKPTLSTVYDQGNGASTNGWFNRRWLFGAILPPTAKNNLFVAQSKNNALGYGAGKGIFTYTVNGIAGTQFGPVIPEHKKSFVAPMVAVPEPSLFLVAIASLVFLKKIRSAR